MSTCTWNFLLAHPKLLLFATRAQVGRLEAQLRGMQVEVERVRNREKLVDRVKMYDVRLAVLLLEEKAMEVEQKQEAIDAANKDLAE